jgi:hypothetical protein
MKHLPKTDSISELAEFWQTHDLTDFEDELEEVMTPVFQRLDLFQVRLSASDARVLRSKARKAHISEGELVSQWVHERLGGG